MTGIDWAAVIGGVGRRTLEPIEQKRLAIDAGSKVQMGLIDGKIVTPSGLADASSIDDLLRSYVARARTVSRLQQAADPFPRRRDRHDDGRHGGARSRRHRDRHAREHGDPGRVLARRARPCILSDGGMVRNIPIDVARNTCADIVIVVNLVEPRARRARSWCRRSSSCRAAWT